MRAKVQELDKEENFFLVRVAAASGEEKVGSVNVPTLANTFPPPLTKPGFEKEGGAEDCDKRGKKDEEIKDLRRKCRLLRGEPGVNQVRRELHQKKLLGYRAIPCKREKSTVYRGENQRTVGYFQKSKSA